MSVKVDIEKKFYKKKIGKKKGDKPTFSLHCAFDAGNELVVLFGRSGSGKTTTLQCIAGLTKPDAGTVRVNDMLYFDSSGNINLPPQQRRVGYVFQHYSLFPHMNVRQNIAFGLKGWDAPARDVRIREVVELVQIEDLESFYPEQLSGGQQQRVVLARALAPKPDILLLDEPFSALDMVVRMHLREEVRAIQQSLGIPVLFITHNPVEAFTIADKVVAFHEGHVQQLGSPEDVFYRPRTVYVAQLVGFSNIFEGEVVEADNTRSEYMVLRSQGISILVSFMDRRVGDTVTWGIRPENIQILRLDHIRSEDTKNVYEAVIRNVVNKGASRLVSLKLNSGGAALVAEVANHIFDELKVDVGDTCLVQLEMSDVVVMNC
jgi:molybdate transport system ATP-binding protein